MALTDKLTAIADAIRAKTGKTDSMTLEQMLTEIASITGGGSSADVRYVTFRNESTGEEYKKPVAYGDDCVDVVAKGLWKTPTKESTAQYNYTFYGWGASDGGAADANILKNITEDKTVYAIFTATVRYYTMTWLDEDGVTELPGQKQWAYGTVPSYTPTKEGYAFDKWTPTPTAVTGDASYTASWSSVVADGTLSTGLAWKLATNGVFTISGAGAMPNFEYESKRPWHNYASQIKTVTIPSTVTSIGNYAFRDCSSLTSIIIPASVTSIGNYAFYGCSNLTSITIPDNVTSIGDSAFGGCSSLTSIIIPASVTSIGKQAFMACTSLTSVTIENGVTIIGVSMFMNCSTLTSITIPASVTSIGKQAFCKSGLESITIPDGVTSLGGSAFSGCTSLSSVAIGNGVTSLGNQTFDGCTGLTSITIPDNVTSIGTYAFDGCSSLTSATFKNTSGWYVTNTEGASSGTNVTVTSTSTAATYLKNTYKRYYWYRK